MAEPNQFDLRGDTVQISYSTRGPFIDQPGLQPKFTYQDQEQKLSFTGDQIRRQQSELGTLVSVSLRVSIDAGGTTLTLLLPAINGVDTATEQPFQTFAIVTQTFGILPHVGAGQVYNVMQLDGVARLIPIL